MLLDFVFKNLNLIFLLFNFIFMIMPVLLAVAFLTLLERKVIGYMQLRKGPNLVGPLGVLQPMADGLKLFMKENFKPSSATPVLFYISPPVFFLMAILLWGVVPVHLSGLNMSLSLLFMITISSLSVYSILGAGWASKSKYSLLGSIRAVAQTVSYEVSLGLVLLPLVLLVGGWGFNGFLMLQSGVWLVFPCLPLFMMWYISTLAETNRAPFDLTEGESELVSGYKVEYSGAPFALFFIGEYAKIILMKVITVVVFLGSGLPLSLFFFSILLMVMKVCFLVFSFLWVRSSFPRIRYDQLMMLMWKGFLPFSIAFLVFYYMNMVLFFGISPYF